MIAAKRKVTGSTVGRALRVPGVGWRCRRPTAVDLFAGAGGLTLGLRRAGFRVVGAIEDDPLAVETYRRNHPEVRVWSEDIRTVPVTDVARRLGLRPGTLDLLAACPPCQSFSSLRTLNHGRRIRNPREKDLVLECLRFVRGLRPKAVMIENVPGLISDSRLRAVRRELHRLGYRSVCRVLDAADYGVPQRRRRMILLASRVGTPTLPAGNGRLCSVRDAIAGLPPAGRSGDPLHDHGENRSERVRALIRRIPRDGGSRVELGGRAQLACHKRVAGFYDVYGRMAWNAVSPTITSGFVNPSKGRFLHPSRNRTITLREAALLQTFPPRYWFSLRRGKYPLAALIGNALPPRFIETIAAPLARQLRSAGLSGARRRPIENGRVS